MPAAIAPATISDAVASLVLPNGDTLNTLSYAAFLRVSRLFPVSTTANQKLEQVAKLGLDQGLGVTSGSQSRVSISSFTRLTNEAAYAPSIAR